MSSFKEIAYKVLKFAGKPLHSKRITDIALNKKLLKSCGKTPWATMNAVLITDVNLKKSKSIFIKAGPSVFTINHKFKPPAVAKRSKRSPIKEEFVKHAIVKYLSFEGWGSFQYGDLHVRGVDIRVKKLNYSRYLSIETKGTSILPQSDEVGFIYSLGQIITRMKDDGTTRNYYGIGLPEFAARIAMRRLPWQVAKRLLLSVFSVNAAGEVEEYSWAELKKFQKQLK